jgi:AcrR family transcriptional regulator
MSERRRYHVGDLPGRLLREARDLLDEGGLKQLNLRAVAARAGVTAGSMYHHYESKTALLGELAAGGFKELRRELEQAREADDGRRLRSSAIAYFRFAQRESALFGLMFDPEIAELPPVAKARAAALKVLHGTVELVAAEQQRIDPPIDKITLAVWAAAHGAASLSASTPDQPELIEDVIAGLESLFRPARP